MRPASGHRAEDADLRGDLQRRWRPEPYQAADAIPFDLEKRDVAEAQLVLSRAGR